MENKRLHAQGVPKCELDIETKKYSKMLYRHRGAAFAVEIERTSAAQKQENVFCRFDKGLWSQVRPLSCSNLIV